MDYVESAPIRRLVVALDASPCSQIVLRTAARLAAHLDARLDSVFVQDTSLVRVAELAVAHEVIVHSARSRPFTRTALERDQRILAEQMESWAADVARVHHVRWRFQILSGPVAAQLMATAGESDLLTLGRFGWPVSTARRQLGSVARTVAGQHRFPRLLLDHEIRPHQPILVRVDRSMSWARLTLAAQLAVAYASPLLVLLDGGEAEIDPLRDQVEQRLVEYNLDIVYRRLNESSLDREILRVGDGALFSGHRRGIEEIPLALFLV